MFGNEDFARDRELYRHLADDDEGFCDEMDELEAQAAEDEGDRMREKSWRDREESEMRDEMAVDKEVVRMREERE
jgi:hypothetical protein